MSSNQDNGASATDIITYIGIPLAVIGILPIFYNTVSTLIVVHNVKRLLRRARIAGMTRGDVINRVIEVDLPRFTITPLDREDQAGEYWNTYAFPSPVRGGTWTAFNWKMQTVGLKTQRISYADQLVQPQADVGFAELISYLMDLGAVPHAEGFRALRTTGLWVPIGTVLLLSPKGDEPCLSIAPLDDSDGNLSLAVKWSRKWQTRSKSSLPPYWVRLRGQPSPPPAGKSDSGPVMELASKVTVDNDEKKPIAEDSKLDTIDTKQPQATPQTMRCHIGTSGLIEARMEDSNSLALALLPIDHLQLKPQISTWFAAAATALGTNTHSILSTYSIPSAILQFSRQDTLPCGVLVLLNVVPESSTPEWATRYDDAAADAEAARQRMRAMMEGMRREKGMTPQQQSASAAERHRASSQAFFDENNARARQNAARAEQRVSEALGSARWSNRAVATHNLRWLKDKGLVDAEADEKRSVERLLFRMVEDKELSIELAAMLEAWQAWAAIAGMKKADYLMLRQKQEMFAWASLVLAVIQDGVMVEDGSLAVDLQESVRIWKKVRLG